MDDRRLETGAHGDANLASKIPVARLRVHRCISQQPARGGVASAKPKLADTLAQRERKLDARECALAARTKRLETALAAREKALAARATDTELLRSRLDRQQRALEQKERALEQKERQHREMEQRSARQEPAARNRPVERTHAGKRSKINGTRQRHSSRPSRGERLCRVEEEEVACVTADGDDCSSGDAHDSSDAQGSSDSDDHASSDGCGSSDDGSSSDEDDSGGDDEDSDAAGTNSESSDTDGEDRDDGTCLVPKHGGATTDSQPTVMVTASGAGVGERDVTDSVADSESASQRQSTNKAIAALMTEECQRRALCKRGKRPTLAGDAEAGLKAQTFPRPAAHRSGARRPLPVQLQVKKAPGAAHPGKPL